MCSKRRVLLLLGHLEIIKKTPSNIKDALSRRALADPGRWMKTRKKTRKLLHAQYDWTTGVLDNGNEWRKFRAVPRSYPLRSLIFCTLFNRGGNRRAFGLPGAGGEHFHCTVEPSSGHIRCRTSNVKNTKDSKTPNKIMTLRRRRRPCFCLPF